eukprot:6204525-Pleurochrysis_carterae.AAC.2
MQTGAAVCISARMQSAFGASECTSVRVTCSNALGQNLVGACENVWNDTLRKTRPWRASRQRRALAGAPDSLANSRLSHVIECERAPSVSARAPRWQRHPRSNRRDPYRDRPRDQFRNKQRHSNVARPRRRPCTCHRHRRWGCVRVRLRPAARVWRARRPCCACRRRAWRAPCARARPRRCAPCRVSRAGGPSASTARPGRGSGRSESERRRPSRPADWTAEAELRAASEGVRPSPTLRRLEAGEPDAAAAAAGAGSAVAVAVEARVTRSRAAAPASVSNGTHENTPGRLTRGERTRQRQAEMGKQQSRNSVTSWSEAQLLRGGG